MARFHHFRGIHVYLLLSGSPGRESDETFSSDTNIFFSFYFFSTIYVFSKDFLVDGETTVESEGLPR